jgi:hypothetical protein
MFAGDTFNYYSNGMIFNSGSSATTSSTVTLYRNVVTNSWSTTQHSQGLYASAVGNLVIEDNIFDHNGWNASISGAQANIFNRNVYLNGNNGPVTFVGNISANSASEGAQFRSGGTISGNLFVADSAGFSIGENPGTSQTPFSTLTSTVATGNVVINSNDIQAASGILARSDGILVNNANGSGVQVTGNIIADPTGQIVNQSGISLNSNVTGITATNNVIYGVAKNPVLNNGTGNTTSPNVINGSGYLDPNRTVQTYDATVLGGPGTLADFLAQAEANPGNPALTAAAVDAYIQAGFTLVVEQVTASPTSGVELPGNTVVFSLRFGQAVTVTGTPTLTLNDGGTATYLAGSGTTALTFSYTVGATDTPVSALAITQANLPNGATIKDSIGNAVNLSGALVTFSGLAVDPPTGPTVSSVVESPSTGDLNAGKTVTLTLNLGAAVTVAGGTPTLTLNDGGTATYTGGSGSSALTFSYTVGSSDTNVASLAATAVNLNGATIKDGSGNPASLSLSGITQAGPQIDTTTPSVSSVVASGTGITAGAGDLATGSVVTLTVNLNEAVTVAGGTPTLTLNDGGAATYSGGSGSSALTFSYAVAAGQNTPDLTVTAVNLNGAAVTNGAGTAANLAGAVTNPAGTLQIDTTTPAVSSVAASGTGITSGSGDLAAGSVVTLTVNLSEAVTVAGGTPTLTLNDGGTASYTGGSGTSALTFSYTVAAGQNTPDLAVTGVNLNGASVKNGAGTAANLSGAVTNPSGSLQIDATTPTVSSVATSGTGITSGSGDLGTGNVVTLTVNLSEAVTVAGGTPTLTLNDGGTATYSGGSGTSALTFSYTVAAGQNTPDLAVTAISLNGASVKNGAGTAANLAGAVTNPSGTLQIDTTAPAVSAVVASGTGITAGAGDLGTGSVVTLTVNLNEAVTVAGGTPTLTLNDGGTASYTGGSGSSALTFSYTVAAGQNTADLAVTAVSLNGATVTNGAGTTANLAGAVTNPAGTLHIDTTTPAVSSVVASGSGITAGSGDLGAGNVVTLTVNLSEAVTVAGGTPTLSLNDGGTATYIGGSGTNALTFSYTAAAGQNTADLAVTAVNLNSASVKNGAGTAANLAGAVANPFGTLQIDTTAPTVSQVTATPGSGTELPGNAVTFTVAFSEAVTVSGTPTLSLNDGGTATYTGGSGTNALTFSYTVHSTDSSVSALAITQANLPNGASIKDGAGNAASLSGALTTFSGLATDIPPVVSSVAESPTSGDLNAGKTVTLTLNLSGAVTVAGGTPTLSLNDGGTATYSGGSGTNALTFSYTVGSSDTNVASLAATAINLNGATVLDSGGNVASLSLSGLTQTGPQIDTTTPVISTIAETPANGDLNAGKVVTYSLTLSEAVTVNTTGGKPTLALNDGGTATYVSGSGSNTLTFSYTVQAGQNTPDLMVSAFNLNGATVTDAAGNTANLSLTGIAQGSPQIDTTTPTVSSVATSGTGITSGTGDLRAGSVVTLTVNLSEAVAVAGGTPTLTLNDGGTATYSGGSGSNALTFSYKVAAGQNTADLAVTAVNLNGATVQDGAGNTANLSAAVANPTGTLQIDTITPTVSSVVTSGTGIKNGAGTLGTGAVMTLTVNLSEAVTVAGGSPTLSLNDGGTATYTGGSGSNALTFSYTVAAGQNTNDLSVTAFNLNGAAVADGAGNAANLAGAITNPQGKLKIYTGTQKVLSTSTTTSGTTSLVAIGSEYALNTSGSTAVIGPELSYNGTPVTSGQFGSWTPIATVQTASGYDVAWQMAGTNQYTIWSTDSSGNYVSNLTPLLAGNSTAFEAFETAFGQDLNGDGTIGITSTLIKTDGTTSLVQYGNNYALDTVGSSTTGPLLQYNGSPVTVGELGGWTPIGAVQTATGYDVAWQVAGTNQYTIWSTDSSGNYLSNLAPVLAGNSTALEAFETTFQQDLNGDGTVGVPTTVIQTDGTTKLVEYGTNYALDTVGSSTTGPLLKYNGSVITAGEFGSWTPIGAVQTASGYDIAWQVSGTNQYTIWSTDSGGNYVSNLAPVLAGNSTALEAFETTFQQDINRDGTVGVKSTLIQTDGTTSLVEYGNNYALDAVGSSTTGPLLKYNGSVVTVGAFGGWTPIGAVQTATGYDIAWQVSGTNQYTIWSTDSSGNYVSNLAPVLAGNSTALQGFETTFQQDLNGDGVITIPAGQTMELTGSYAGEIDFGGATGTLKIDHAAEFTGTIGGPLTPTDQIDFADVNFTGVTLGYSGNNSPGTLTVSDGTHTASLAVLGNHSLANFTASSDGHGGTIVVDPPLAGQSGSSLDQRVALFSQYMASAFPSGAGSAVADTLEPGIGMPPQLASPTPTQLHASMLS